MAEEYIKREDAIRSIADHDEFKGERWIKEAWADYLLEDAKPADVAPVVRCKDCKFAHMTYGGECKYCDAWESEESLYLDGDFFCAFGERKDNDKINRR